MNISEFKQALEEKGITLSPSQLDQFETYFKLLVEWNEKVNLTAITDKEEVYLKHFYDSISPSFFIDFNQDISLCDVGAGAGFPSIPLKICFPSIKLSIVDSLNKRITFLKTLTDELGLQNVNLYHDRAETFGKSAEHREQYDYVTARAVARLSVLSELCLPLVKKGGKFIALKGAGADDEVLAGKKALTILGGKMNQDFYFQLPKEDSKRHIILIDKVKETPKKYPRKPGTPNKQPLE
jgi:16S rRNA (guanine527-N7)-methyltransferase